MISPKSRQRPVKGAGGVGLEVVTHPAPCRITAAGAAVMEITLIIP